MCVVAFITQRQHIVRADRTGVRHRMKPARRNEQIICAPAHGAEHRRQGANNRYRPPGGGEVELAREIAAAVARTMLYLPGDPVAAATPIEGRPTVEVTAETTLAAARRLGGDAACLVFASARNPGGGFLTGAQAQEESLARASALHSCRQAAPQFYAVHRQQPDLRYSDRVIYSPSVPVFRDDDGTSLAPMRRLRGRQ